MKCKKMLNWGGVIVLLYLFIISCTSEHKESTSRQQWFERYDYDSTTYKGRSVIVVWNKDVEQIGDWIVRPAFIGEYAQVDDSLISKGYKLVFYDVANEFGNVNAQKDFDSIVSNLQVKYNLKNKFILEGFSRGGFFALCYAENSPNKVEKLYLDAPVCDLYSFPLHSDYALYQKASAKWADCGLSIDSIHDYPIRNISKIKNIPTIVVYGEFDDEVPYLFNFGRCNTSSFSEISIIKKSGTKHHPHSLVPCDTIVKFLTKSSEQ